MSEHKLNEIKAIIGLGNPGAKYYHNRHNIGFQVLDSLAKKNGANWKSIDKMEISEIQINGKNVLLIKPLTFMNSSGEIVPYLQKKGIKSQNLLVVHDELELPFGTVKYKFAGSAKGHNGLRSLISFCGADFARIRVGIGRPENKEHVPDYVLQNFNESPCDINNIIQKTITEIESLFM